MERYFVDWNARRVLRGLECTRFPSPRLAGHAAFETFSVLTRLPPPARRTPTTVARLLAANFPHSRFLSADAATALLAELHTVGIAGGAVYDALVGAVAREHGMALGTRDRRALDTYRALDVRLELLS
jgi:hypothetical protein